MATTYKRFTKILFVALNVLASIAYLLACLAPRLDPAKWWFISLLGLGFAFIIVTLIAFILFWLVFKPKFIFISLIPLLIGWKSITIFFAFHIPEKFDYDKPPGTFRLVHWNVARFIEWRKNNNKGSQPRMKMMDQIKEQNADVICMQEFFTSVDPQYYDNLHYIMKELGYPYFFYSWDNDGYHQWNGQIIFSRFPIIDSGMVRFPKPSQPEALIHVDVQVGKDTVRIYTTHLQSVKFKKADYDKIEDIKKNDGVVQNSKSIYSKLRTGVVHRARQAEVVKEVTSCSPYPYVLTGDFNDVPNSYAYATITSDSLQDAFLVTGLGIGRTYSYIAPTLRIDYMLTTKNFKVRQFNRILKNLSDHYMLVADLELQK